MMRIVVVEDEIRIREGIIKIIKKLDSRYQVVGEAVNGLEGEKIITETMPDLIITDIRMPEKNGIEMISSLKADLIEPKIIFLTAYSDFEYAKSAIDFGAADYLLKPISFPKFKESLEKIKIELEKEEDQALNAFFKKLYYNESIPPQLMKMVGNLNIRKIVMNKFHFKNSNFKKHLTKIDRTVKDRLRNSEVHELVGFSELVTNNFEVIFIFYTNNGDVPIQEMSLIFQEMLREMFLENEYCVSEVETREIYELANIFEEVDSILEWGIIFGSHEILTSALNDLVIDRKSFGGFTKELYRLNSEVSLEELTTILKDILNWIEERKEYANPKLVKNCFIKIVWRLYNLLWKEENTKASLELAEVLANIQKCCLFSELVGLTEMFLDELIQKKLLQNQNISWPIRKTKQLFKENIGQGVTLDEIANELNLTREYLSSQFRKETGTTFSTYMKDYRILKAKELLVSSSLKIFEVSEALGYTDAKYFSQVFKKETGYIPLDYRKMKKN